MQQMTPEQRKQQRKRIAEVFAKIDENFTLADACEQLLAEEIDVRLLLRKAEEIFTPWIKDYHREPEGARKFLSAMQPFWKRRLLNQDIILNRIDGYVKDEEFYFFIYKRAPQYGMEFGKVEVGKYLLINCTEYVHTHFENLVRGFNLDSDDLIEIINDPIVVKAIGISPDQYESILEDILDSDYFEYTINDIARRYLDVIGYATNPIWLVRVMAVLLDNGAANVIDIDTFAENALKLKEAEGVNWDSTNQSFYEELLEKYGADYRLIEAFYCSDDGRYY